MVRRKKRNKSNFSWAQFGWFILALLLKVFGIAFLVQGFLMQLSTGVLYYGIIHYLLGLIFIMLAWGCFRNMPTKR